MNIVEIKSGLSIAGGEAENEISRKRVLSKTEQRLRTGMALAKLDRLFFDYPKLSIDDEKVLNILDTLSPRMQQEARSALESFEKVKSEVNAGWESLLESAKREIGTDLPKDREPEIVGRYLFRKITGQDPADKVICSLKQGYINIELFFQMDFTLFVGTIIGEDVSMNDLGVFMEMPMPGDEANKKLSVMVQSNREVMSRFVENSGVLNSDRTKMHERQHLIFGKLFADFAKADVNVGKRSAKEHYYFKLLKDELLTFWLINRQYLDIEDSYSDFFIELEKEEDREIVQQAIKDLKEIDNLLKTMQYGSDQVKKAVVYLLALTPFEDFSARISEVREYLKYVLEIRAKINGIFNQQDKRYDFFQKIRNSIFSNEVVAMASQEGREIDQAMQRLEHINRQCNVDVNFNILNDFDGEQEVLREYQTLYNYLISVVEKYKQPDKPVIFAGKTIASYNSGKTLSELNKNRENERSLKLKQQTLLFANEFFDQSKAGSVKIEDKFGWENQQKFQKALQRYLRSLEGYQNIKVEDSWSRINNIYSWEISFLPSEEEKENGLARISFNIVIVNPDFNIREPQFEDDTDSRGYQF
ncbi:MAG: hypothetical protein V1898_04720 [Patescibacteria group bacterium]